MLIRDKEVQSIERDPNLESADVDRSNNYFPRRVVPSRFKVFKEEKKRNEMQEAREPIDDDEKKEPKEVPESTTEKDEDP